MSQGSNASALEPSAVVVIPYHREQPQELEAVSLKRCGEVLKGYTRCLAVPRGMETGRLKDIDPGLTVCEFDARWFASAVGYNLLCRHPSFYREFERYNYMLLYQLDAYVFRDELGDWCGGGYDYVGAPWLHYEFRAHSRKAWTKSRILHPFLRQVGNGGFTLRRIRTLWRASFWLWPLSWLLRNLPEDVFWAHVGARLWPGFRIPGVDEALRFAWDAAPEECFERCKGRLPFGVHAWNTSHLAFWESHGITRKV